MSDFVGTSGDDVQSGTSSADTFDYSQGGNDHLEGKGGDDTFTLGGALTADDQIDGGGGFDDLTLTDDTTVHFSETTLVNVERIEMAEGHTYTLTSADATVGAGKTLELFCGGNLVFDGSAETDGVFSVFTTDGVDNVTGGAGDDWIDTDRGADTLSGGGGADHLDSGLDFDNDTIYGGDGNDSIIFRDDDSVFGGSGDDTALFLGSIIGPWTAEEAPATH